MVNSHKGGVEKLAVPNVKVLARTCDRCVSFRHRLPLCGGKELFVWGCGEGFDVVVLPKWWICCLCFTHVVHHVIREIICRCSGIILALSSHVRCFLLGYILSPPRACLTISYHSARAAPTRLLHPFSTGNAVFVVS